VTQAAVAWILATVFVRFCEDNDLIASPWIAGPIEPEPEGRHRLLEAEERHQAFFRDHPEKNDRDWLIAAFEHLASTNETVAGLFDRDHNPLWELDPSYEKASDLLKFWRRTGPDGEIVHDFTDKENLDTRFLGDLYQDLSDHAKKTYALLQTPEFVEEFILDLTLEPAVEEFGLEPVWKHKPKGWPGDEPIVRGLRTIDPACGSGHFLLGIFHRLLKKWQDYAPGLDRWEHIRRALESVHGCDKNPFAAEIARFRLLIAALNVANEKRLDAAPTFPINVAVGDSLLHGRNAPGVQTEVSDALFGNAEQFCYQVEDIQEFAAKCDLLGESSYHVVVANPPYITARDRQEKSNYKKAYKESCHGLWTLAVPFTQRIFELAIRTGGRERSAGHVGQITANAFMKREFGEKMVKDFLPVVDLTHVIDTSGAFIPGHGTPTVILIGRNRIPFQQDSVRTVLGIRGEPEEPEDPSKGKVWASITQLTNKPGSESEWVSVVDADRMTLSSHPWSLSGGGAGDLVKKLNTVHDRLADVILRAGFYGDTHADEAFTLPGSGPLARMAEHLHAFPSSRGDHVRDWRFVDEELLIFPYGEAKNLLSENQLGDIFIRHFWPYRSELWARTVGRGTYRSEGRSWWAWHQLPKDAEANPISIAFSFVATHNHFVLDRGNKIFNRSAPVIRFPKDVDESWCLALLGLLNSSTACFWMKQVCHDKGSQSGTGGFMNDEWERFYEFTGTKLQGLPVPKVLPKQLGRVLDDLGKRLLSHEPQLVLESSAPSIEVMKNLRENYRDLRAKLIALQEELDWRIYSSYGLLSPLESEGTTFTDLDSLPDVYLGERAFEIALARQVWAGMTRTVWFSRHGSTPTIEIPERWPENYRKVVQARLDIIAQRTRDIGLIERAEYKRRWADESWERKEKSALRFWILSQCEDESLWFGLRNGDRHPRTLTTGQLADRLGSRDDVRTAVALYAANHMDMRDVPVVEVLEQVIADEHVPYLAALRYKDSGLRKRGQWEEVWELQRKEDRTVSQIDIPVPPKYVTGDFRVFSYWAQRGRLDVPKERFISYPGASPDSDDSLLLGWAGWDHKDQAQALVNLVNDRAEQAAWGSDKLKPLLAGLLEVMPWVHQWHGEYDDEWEGAPAEEFQAFLDDQRARLQVSEQDLRDWRPEKKGRGRRKA
jgi:hypothetical protein